MTCAAERRRNALHCSSQESTWRVVQLLYAVTSRQLLDAEKAGSAVHETNDDASPYGLKHGFPAF